MKPLTEFECLTLKIQVAHTNIICDMAKRIDKLEKERHKK